MSVFSSIKFHRIGFPIEFMNKNRKVISDGIVKEFKFEIDEFQERKIYIVECKGIVGVEDGLKNVDGDLFTEI